ncbi:Two-component sensor histidine kinase, contains HisKA and HATPase domains [Ekhidna lutea]|uniref:Two-component sensor histidine kinase, contains HisKA and HATPase domains n=1 Tax=Ekhidna lutea TaxID=447679 RepID=A0A239K4E0_EKHLU|nr:hypothetical protein [Ekhidna lutea]SNT13187.1 Two-component sensor histidine kinase, contains HisKA and HATPase domains [Ekhidna lutea]
MRDFSSTPKHYVNSDLEPIAKVMNIGFYLLLFFLSIVLIRQIYQVDYKIGSLAAIGIILSFVFRHQFLKGHLKRSVMLITVFFTILLTFICSLGHGIHDIGLIAFPVIIGFSSIILDQRQLIVASILSIASLIWLVIGDLYDSYSPVPVSDAGLGDFVIASSIILLGGFIAFNLTELMKRSLEKAKYEMDNSQKEAERLRQDSQQKMIIIKEIHQAVINSLNYVQRILDHKEKVSEELIPLYESIRRKIVVIEVAHEILHAGGAPIMLDVSLMTKELIRRVEKSFKSTVIHFEVDNSQCLITLDDAINYGICLVEILFDVDTKEYQSINLTLKVNGTEIKVTIKGLDPAIKEDSKVSLIIDLLTRQLKGSLNKAGDEITLKFDPGKLK